ncbi:hypothetical protein OROMI_012251 [Orobanche minor]
MWLMCRETRNCRITAKEERPQLKSRLWAPNPDHAMFLDLNRKVADVLEDNENLKKIIVLFWIFEKYSWIKKEKELAVVEYNSLKDRNEFLKAQVRCSSLGFFSRSGDVCFAVRSEKSL